MRSTLFALGLAVLLVGAAHAEDGVGVSDIKIGMVNAQSGPAGALGSGMLEGARAVFKEVNKNGGVHGRKINLVIADDGYEPDNTMEETLKMVQQQHVFALFGFVGTPTTSAVLPIVREMEVPLVGAFTGAMALRQPVSPDVFNVRASYDDETELLIARLHERGARKIAVMYQFDGFGLAVLRGVEKALKRRDLAVAATGSFARNTRDVHGAVTTLAAAAPDAVVMAGPYAPLAAFIGEARGAGLKAQLATVSFVGTDELLQLLGDKGDGLLISQVVPLPGDDSLAITRECRRLLALHAKADLGFVNFEGCIAARLLVTALDRAGPGLTRQGLRTALESLHNVDLGGLSVSMSADNHQAMRQVFLTELRGGKVLAVGPAKGAVASR